MLPFSFRRARCSRFVPRMAVGPAGVRAAAGAGVGGGSGSMRARPRQAHTLFDENGGTAAQYDVEAVKLGHVR
jgi:hypothetical protein